LLPIYTASRIVRADCAAAKDRVGEWCLEAGMDVVTKPVDTRTRLPCRGLNEIRG
jgi:hypothetical protein